MEDLRGKAEACPGIRMPMWWRPLLFICVLLPAFASAEKARIEVLLSSDAGYYREVVAGLTAALIAQHPDAEILTVSLSEFSEAREFTDSSRLIISVGTSASEAAIKGNGNYSLLCTFLPRSAYLALLQQHNRSSNSRSISAIFLDQPMSRYLALIKTLVPKATRLGTAVGPISKQLLPNMRSLAEQQNLQLRHVELNENTNPVATLSPVVENSDVFLATPDHADLNRVIAKWLLYLSIRQRIPVIGFSLAYVNAGALAAVYSSPEDIGRDAGEVAGRWLNQSNRRLQVARYPEYFSLRTNPSVARALGIALPNEAELYEQVKNKSKNIRANGGAL